MLDTLGPGLQSSIILVGDDDDDDDDNDDAAGHSGAWVAKLDHPGRV